MNARLRYRFLGSLDSFMERRLVATRAIPFSVMSTSNAVRKNRNDISHENSNNKMFLRLVL